MELNTLMLIGAMVTSWAALGIALITLAKYRRQHQQMSQSLTKLAKELRASQSGTVGMGRRILALESRLRHTSERQEELSENQEIAFPTPYRQAARMLDSGDSIGDVAANCGLSRSEASLMSLVRGKGVA